MIGYITLGTNDLARATAFYDALLAEVGATRFMETERNVAWSAGSGGAGISVCKPFDGKGASVGNGSMVALSVDSPAKVAALHARALSLGGTDEGAPGQRGPGYYGAYFRDLDGNKLCAFTRNAS
jgi:catechol 2,3-dioxygenase-like lactoylglutathione lyase family enzyme